MNRYWNGFVQNSRQVWQNVKVSKYLDKHGKLYMNRVEFYGSNIFGTIEIYSRYG